MEEKPSDTPVRAAPSGKKMWAIIAVVVVIAVVASGALYFLGSQPQYAKITLVTLDFGYNQIANPDLHPEYHVKAGKPIWIVMTNEGTNDHEFLLYTNKDAALISSKAALAQALRDNPTATTNDTAKQAALDEYNTLHDSWDNLTRYNNIDRDVAPNATTDLLFVIHEVGTYFFVCHQVDTDAVPWKIHQEHGMWGTLVVEA